jgi:Double sensory domain of two-component sensor kinase
MSNISSGAYRVSGLGFVLAAPVALLVAAVLYVMLQLQTGAQEEFITRDRQAQMRLVGATLTSTFDQAGKFALALAESTARRPDIATPLAAGDKAKLQALSQGAYDYLSRQAGVQIYGYHSPDIRYLLRMHRPDLGGDDISGFRPMVVAANKLKRAQSGIEIGVAGLGIRGIALIEQGETLLGTMEVGLDLRPLIESVKSSTNADIAVVLAPAMSGIALDPKLSVFGDLALALSSDDDLAKALLKSGQFRITKDIQVSSVVVDGRPYSLIAQPLVDFSGRQVGATVALKPNTGREGHRIATELWVAALVGGILAYMAFAVLFRFACMRKDEA